MRQFGLRNLHLTVLFTLAMYQALAALIRTKVVMKSRDDCFHLFLHNKETF